MPDAKDEAQEKLKELPIKAGQRYRHFKKRSPEYEIVALALKEDTLEPLVVYRNAETGSTWVRTYQDFTGEVTRPEYNYKGPRFTLISK